MEAAGGAWPPDELEHYEATVATLTNEMGADAFERTRAGGRALDKPQAIASALRTGG
jgi:hypothetical protein